MIAVCRRVRALNRNDRCLLAEALLLLGVSWCGLRLLPFAILRRVLDRYAWPRGHARRVGGRLQERERRRHALGLQSSSGQRREIEEGTAARIAWAVAAVGSRSPLRITCLPRALAADAMLRRRGLRSRVVLGVRRHRRACVLESHAWIEHDGRVLLGAVPGLDEYAVLATPRP